MYKKKDKTGKGDVYQIGVKKTLKIRELHTLHLSPFLVLAMNPKG